MKNPTANPTTAFNRRAHYSRMIRGFLGVPLLAGLTAALLFVVFMYGCRDEGGGIVNVCITPQVIRTSPTNGGMNEPLSKTRGATGLAKAAAVKIITATFNTPMDPKSITTASFIVQQGATYISGTVSYSDTTAIFIATNGLGPNLTYTCTITTGAKDVVGTTLAGNYVWTFSTRAAGTPTLVAPVNGAINISTSPTLIWNDVPGANTYRLQVSLSPAFVGTVYNDSTRTSTSQAISGLTVGTTYYWRVNAKISGGSSAYSTIWSFTTIAPPAAPVLVSPLAAAQNQATSLTLSWLASTGASTYRLQVSTSSSFATTLVDDSTITGTLQPITGLTAATTYYWRVNAKNVAGTSAYSTRSFTTIIAGAPTLVAPVDGAVSISTSPTMIWNNVTGANTYRLQISTSSSFATTVFNDSTITNTSQAISGLTIATTYYWRVNAKTSGGTSAYSAVWSFATIAPPAAPVLVAPLDVAQSQATSLTLSWLASTGANTYRLQVSTSSSFATTVFNDSTITGTSQPITGLTAGTTYYWRVNAKNVAGTSAYSTRSFTTIVTLLQPPLLAAPADAAINVTTSPTLSWNASTGADSYRLQVDTSSVFASTIFDASTLLGLSQSLAGLTNGKTYYWRVNAKNSGGTSGWSTIWRFTVASVPPPSVNLRSAASFGALGGNAGITNQGIYTQINNGNIATTAASTLITGFHDATLAPNNVFTETPLNIGAVEDTIYTATAPAGSVAGAVATQGLADAQTAYNYLAALPPGSDPNAGELGGQTLAPGTYTSAGGTFNITSVDLTLDAQGDPNARFVFQMASALTVGAAGPSGARSVILINNAQAKNVFWQVGSAATINGAGGGTMVGTIIASSGVTFSTAGNVTLTRLEGRALSLVASVTMVNTIINVPLP